MPSSKAEYDWTKYEQTNQQIIKQNIQIHAQLRGMQKKFQECQEENTALKVRIGIVEQMNEQLTDDLSTLKKEITERTPTLELIATHLGDLSKYFGQLCLSQNDIDFKAPEHPKQSILPPKKEATQISTARKSLAKRSVLSPIKENEETIEYISNRVDEIEFS